MRIMVSFEEVEGPEAVKPNICCVIADSLRWDVFISSNPINILKLGKARKAYSIGNSTGPTMHGYLMNYPPIGIGEGLFIEGKSHLQGEQTIFYPFRRWMPKYFKSQGYFTIWMSANPIPIRMDQELDGIYQKYFNHWGADEYQEMDVATPQIIKDLDLIVKLNKEQPIFAVILLLDTHSPYHDGEGKVHLIIPSKPEEGYERQVRAATFIDDIFPNFINIFSRTERPTEFIFTSDHGENFGGSGWGHNSFMPTLQFGEKLFAIPFMRGRIDDWARFKVLIKEDEK